MAKATFVGGINFAVGIPHRSPVIIEPYWRTNKVRLDSFVLPTQKFALKKKKIRDTQLRIYLPARGMMRVVMSSSCGPSGGIPGSHRFPTFPANGCHHSESPWFPASLETCKCNKINALRSIRIAHRNSGSQVIWTKGVCGNRGNLGTGSQPERGGSRLTEASSARPCCVVVTPPRQLRKS